MDGDALIIIGLSVLLVAAAVAAMAVGVMLRRPCLRGSCGGAVLRDAKGEALSCATCPNRRRRRVDQGSADSS